MGTAPIVITAHGQLQRSADATYPFQQEPNFWYLTGINNPDIILVMDKDKEYLILPPQSTYQQVFDGVLNTRELTAISGIDTLYDHEEGWKQLGGRLRKVKHVATLPPPPQYVEVYGMYTNPARRMLIRAMKKENEHIELLDLQQHMVRMRSVKQPQELAAIQAAIAVTRQGLQAVTRSSALTKYAFEYEIEADITRVFGRAGSMHAFDPIIAGGSRACVLHNTGNKGQLSADELLLFDIGASVDGYAADISRTISLSEPTKRQQAVFDAVVEVQNYAFEQLKPGVLLKEYELRVEHFMGEKLRELGLIKTIDTASVRAFYPHAASHHLGLAVHDVSDERPLEPNMVVTVEPGIYIPEEGIGVRIEDDVRITDIGVEVLSNALPSRLR